MSRLAEFRQLEQQLAAQLAELEAMKNDGALKKEIEFERKLRDLMAEYNVNLGGVINILDPKAYRRAPAAVAVGQRKDLAIDRDFAGAAAHIAEVGVGHGCRNLDQQRRRAARVGELPGHRHLQAAQCERGRCHPDRLSLQQRRALRRSGREQWPEPGFCC